MAAPIPLQSTRAASDPASLRDDQLRILFRTGAAVLINPVNAVIVAAILWRQLPHAPLVAWVALMTIVTIGRLLMRRWFFRAPGAFPPHTWLKLYTLGAGLTGAIWGMTAVVILWTDYAPYHLLVGLVGAGMIAGALALLYVHIVAFAAFTVPYALPLAAAFLVQGDASYAGIGAMMVIYGVALAFTARIFNASYRQTAVLRDDLARSNAELEQNIESRTAALRASEQQLRVLADSLPVLIAYVNLHERYMFVNRTAEDWYGRSASSIIGRRIDEVIRPEHYEQLERYRKLVYAGTAVHVEEKIVYPDGVERWIDLQYIPDRAEDGTVRGFYTVLANITERKRMEEELAQVQKMEAIGQLAGGIAHDFNNLLGVIIGNLDVLRPTVKDRPDLRKNIEAALTAAGRGAELTQRVLAFGRRQTLQPRLVDVNVMVGEMSKLLGRTLGEIIEIRLKLRDGLWPCFVDPGQLENAILNLAVNARDAMPGGGTLAIETANIYIGGATRLSAELAPGDYVRITVTDSGTGMPAEVAARAFEPYFTTKKSGTGLGLSMVYGFAKQSDGHAVIASEEGRGTSVHMYFPRAMPSVTTDIKPPARQTDTPQAGSGERVLLVEDNEALRGVALAMLQQLGYKTVEAGDSVEALVCLERDPGIQLLFTDIVLPGDMNGFALAEEAIRQRPGLRVLFTTGFADPEAAPGGAAPVKGEILAKPFRLAELSRAIRAALAEPSPTLTPRAPQ